jgi:regulator of sigma E protease
MTSLVTAALVLIALSHVPGLFRLAVARLARMRVERVVVGAIPIFRRGKWIVGAIPVGTFVIIAGRDPTGQPTDPALFTARPWSWKLPILLAGPLSFYLVSVLAMAVTYVAWGVPAMSQRPMVGAVRDGSPAQRAGLQIGDEILSIDGTAITDLGQVAPAIARAGQQVTLDIARHGDRQRVVAEPIQNRIGIEIWPVEVFEHSLGRALAEAALFPIRYTRAVVAAYRDVFVGRSKAEMSGPVGIVRAMKQASSHALKEALTLFAIFCVQLGFWFLTPLPIFDGGKLIAHLFRKKPDHAPSDHGTIELVRRRMPSAVIAMLVVLGLAAVGLTLQDGHERWEAALMFSLVAVGLVLRHPAAWSMSRTLSLMSIVGAPLFAWLSLRPAASWFGLQCPACQRTDGRPVLARKNEWGCLSCGSAWRINR